jgi:hypothetical protein
VRRGAKSGEVVLVPGAEHLFRPGWEQVLDRLVTELPEILASPPRPAAARAPVAWGQEPCPATIHPGRTDSGQGAAWTRRTS